MAAVDYFLRVDDLEGESTAVGFERYIEVESFSWGVTNPTSLGGAGGGGAGKASFSEFIIVKRVDKSSARLWLYCAQGRHIDKVQFVSRRTPNFVYLQITLTGAVVSSFKEAGTQGELPLEEVGFTFAKIEFDYTPLLPTGQPGPTVHAGWDLLNNRTT